MIQNVIHVTFTERLAAQLVEARRMAQVGGVPRGRLALMLFDNAAESLLRTTADTYLSYAKMIGSAYSLVENADSGDMAAQAWRASLATKIVSARRRKKIERDFDSLVDYVFEQEEWPLGDEFANCLKVLHRFRNAAYHQDHVRPDVLGPAVVIYAYLVAHLLQNRRVIAYELRPTPTEVLEFLSGEAVQDDHEGLPCQHSGNLESRMAQRLLRDFQLDHGGIAQVLGNHLRGRLDDIERDLDEVAGYLYDLPTKPREFAVRTVQWDPKDFASAEPPPDFWTRSLPVNIETLSHWRAKADALATIDNGLTALETFGALERSIAPFEAKAAHMAVEVDRAIQLEIDLYRGK